MRIRWCLLTLAAGLGLCLGTLRADDPPPSPEHIQQLIKQLGGPKFIEREKAKRELDTIGAPALQALKEASKSDNPELKSRAAELVRIVEERVTTAALLAPKKVRLNVKDVPVTEVLADLSKQSGYAFDVLGDRNTLANRRITLDTGAVTFWEAFDKLCAKANLQEVLPANPNGVFPQDDLPLIRGKGIKIRPAILPVPLLPLNPKIQRLQPLDLEKILPPMDVPRQDRKPGVPRDLPAPAGNPQGLGISVVVLDGGVIQVQAPGQPPQIPLPPGMSPEQAAKYKELIQLLQKLNQGAPGQNAKQMEATMRQLREAIEQLQDVMQVLPPGGGAGVGGAGVGGAGVGGAPGSGKAGNGAAGLPGKAGAGGQPGQPGNAVRPVVGAVPAPTGNLASNPILIKAGKHTEYPTSYAGSVRIRALPASKAAELGLPPKRDDEALVILEVTPEPRLPGFQIAGAPRIDKAIDDQDRFLFPNLEHFAGADFRSHASLSQGLQKFVAIRFPLKDEQKDPLPTQMKELAGSISAQVIGEILETLVVDNVMNAARQSVKHPAGGSLTIMSITKLGQNYRVQLRLEGELANNFPGNAGARIIVNGNIVQNGPGDRASQVQMPVLVDAKGRPFQHIGTSSGISTVNGAIAYRTVILTFRPQEDQEEPARLVMHGPRMIPLQVPFSLENVPLSK